MPGPLGHETAVGDQKPGGRDVIGGFITRTFSGLGRPEEVEWGRLNHLTEELPFSHHLTAVIAPDLFAKHPEFFPFVEGKRLRPSRGSSAWNPDLGRDDVAQFAAGQAAAWFDAHPQADAFSLGINDSVVFGESPETLSLVTPSAWFRARPDFSRLVFSFMNRAAAELAKTHPDKYLGCLAYYWAENAPPFPVDRHVIPVLTADRTQAYDEDFRREEFDLQVRWAKTHEARPPGGLVASAGQGLLPPRLGLYDYLYGAGFLIPRQPVHALAEQIIHAHQVGFTDYYAEVYPNWGLDGPLPWVIAQLIRDPAQKVDALLDEYFRRYFREAAEPMQQFYARCEEQWMRQSGPPYWLKHFRNESQARLFPSAVCVDLRKQLEAARRLARSDAVRQRVALVSDSFGVTERFVAMNEARVDVSNRLLRAKHDDADVRALFEYLAKRSEFISYTQRLTEQQPLAFAAPIRYDDFLRNHPAFALAYVLASEGVTQGLADRPEPEIKDALEASAAIRATRTREVSKNGGLEGAIVPGRKIAGLSYAMDVPAPWISQVEPMQHSNARVSRVSAHSGEQGLHIAGSENTTMFQWLPITGGKLYIASAACRARISPSDAVMLTLGWLDAQQRPVGANAVIRVPDGNWTDWITLRQGMRAPANATWAGLAIRVQHQVDGDWAEFDDLSLLEVRDAAPVAGPLPSAK